MAKSNRMNKRGMTIEIESCTLEEYWEIPYRVVGDREWLSTAFEEGAIEDGKAIEVESPDDLFDIKMYLLTRPALGVDTETAGIDKRAGLDPWREGSNLLMLQIGTPEMVYIVQPKYVPYFKDVLESENIVHLGHNLVFDFKYLFVKYGIHINNFYDSMLAEQLLTSGLNGIRVGLAEVARRYAPYRIINKDTRKDFIDFKGIFSKKMLYYAARDIDLLFPIRDAQKVALLKWKLEQVAQDEFDIIPCTAVMEVGGVFLNQDTLRLALKYWHARGEELETKIIQVYDDELKKTGKKKLSLIPEIKEAFDLNSQSQKLEVLRNMGFDIKDVKRETLEELDSEITKLLAEYSEITKVTSTYGDNMLKRVNHQTGRLHPEFHQLGSGDNSGGKIKKGTIATGRFSSDFQQLPRAEERFAVVKDQEEIQAVKDYFFLKIQELKAQEAA